MKNPPIKIASAHIHIPRNDPVKFHENPMNSLKVLYRRRGSKNLFSEILKVNIFLYPYLNEITCVDPFR